MKAIKQFGLPRTCTNVTEWLVRSNFKITFFNNYPCWKHGRNTIVDRKFRHDERNIDVDDARFLICTKHPYDWLFSLLIFENIHSRKHKKKADDFLQGDAWHYKDDNRTNSSNPIDVFNELTLHWFSLSSDSKILQQIKNEDLVKDQVATMIQLEKAFDLERKNEEIKTTNKRISPGVRLTKEAFEGNELGFTKKQIKYINKRLDKDAVKMAGYELWD